MLDFVVSLRSSEIGTEFGLQIRCTIRKTRFSGFFVFSPPQSRFFRKEKGPSYWAFVQRATPWQATKCPLLISRSSGVCSFEQRAHRTAGRSANGQPCASLRKSGGSPGIAATRWFWSNVGTHASRAFVYGCPGDAMTLCIGPSSTIRPP